MGIVRHFCLIFIFLHREHCSVEFSRSLPSMSETGSAHGNIYKPIGMVPKYTGYVPSEEVFACLPSVLML